VTGPQPQAEIHFFSSSTLTFTSHFALPRHFPLPLPASAVEEKEKKICFVPPPERSFAAPLLSQVVVRPVRD
jgi:hypothetical protein